MNFFKGLSFFLQVLQYKYAILNNKNKVKRGFRNIVAGPLEHISAVFKQVWAGGIISEQLHQFARMSFNQFIKFSNVPDKGRLLTKPNTETVGF